VFRENAITEQSEERIDEVAKFCGWTRMKGKKEYLMWDRVNVYLNNSGFPQMCGKDDYIPEHIMYALIGKAKSVKATRLWILGV